MFRDVCIHSARVGFEVCTSRGLAIASDFLPPLRILEFAVHGPASTCLAQDLREFTDAIAAHHVHLPHSVLRGDVALREENIVQRAGLNCGYAVASRVTVTGAERPLICKRPSSWGKAELATK